MPISQWMGQKPMVHLHTKTCGTLQQKGAPTVCGSIDGTGEHYAKWNKPDSKRQIPYYLTY